MPGAVHGVMRAVVDLIDRHVLISESRVHPVGKGLELLFCEDPSSDASLVGHDDDYHPGVDGGPANIEDTIDKMEILDAVDVTPVFVNDAVPIEKQRSFHG